MNLAFVGQMVQGAMTHDSALLEGRVKRAMAMRQSSMLQQQAADADARGGVAAGLERMKGSQLEGQQATGYAASGVDAGSGSPARAMLDTRMMTDLDAQTIKGNAAREAWGYSTKADLAFTQGQIDYKAGQDKADAAEATALTAPLNSISFLS